jgi:hypothetical protein
MVTLDALVQEFASDTVTV